MMKAWFFRIRLSEYAEAFGKRVLRDDLVTVLAQFWQPLGLVGVNQGVLLVGDPQFKWDRWPIDAALVPSDRDWVGALPFQEVEFYFNSENTARTARQSLAGALTPESFELVGNVEPTKKRDWNAEWRKSFQGCEVGKFWKVLPPPLKGKKEKKFAKNLRPLIVNPGAGFGTGTHETTQLCLEALAGYSKSGWMEEKSVLDFGSGSGILSVASALTGAKNVTGVEIDDMARGNASENSRLNGVTRKVKYQEILSKTSQYDLVIANILRPVLLEFCPALVAAIKENGKLILSGLMEKDLDEVKLKYKRALIAKKFKPRIEVQQKNEWFSLTFEL